jgi:hypothetical protein
LDGKASDFNTYSFKISKIYLPKEYKELIRYCGTDSFLTLDEDLAIAVIIDEDIKNHNLKMLLNEYGWISEKESPVDTIVTLEAFNFDYS